MISLVQLCRICKATPINTLKDNYARVEGKPICQDCIDLIKSGETTVLPRIHEFSPQEGSLWKSSGVCEAHNQELKLACKLCSGGLCVECPSCCDIEIDLANLGKTLFLSRQKVSYLLSISSAKSSHQTEFSELETDLESLTSGQRIQELLYIESTIHKTYAALQRLDPTFAFISYDTAIELLTSGKPFPVHPISGVHMHWFEWGKSQLHLRNLASQMNTTVWLNGFRVPYYSRSVTLGDGSIVLAGGRMTTSEFGVCYVFLITLVNGSANISKLPPMVFGRSNHALVCHKDTVYAIGGCNHRNVFFDKVEKLDLASDNWEECASTPQTRDSVSGVSDVLNDCIYVAGGRVDNGNILDSIIRYHAFEDYWTVIEVTLPQQVDTCGIVLLPGDSSQLLVFGGLNAQHDSTNSVYVVDLKRQRVSQQANMVGSGGCIVNEAKVYGRYLYAMPFFGYETRSAERLDLDTMLWESLI